MQMVAILVALVFALLSTMHLFWAFGSQRISDVVIPHDTSGRAAFTPSRRSTLLVAGGLALASLLLLAKAELLPLPATHQVVHIGLYGLASVFLLRAVGDFRYVGFLKSVRDTPFACWDRVLYSPLCLVLGIAVLGLVRT